MRAGPRVAVALVLALSACGPDCGNPDLVFGAPTAKTDNAFSRALLRYPFAMGGESDDPMGPWGEIRSDLLKEYPPGTPAEKFVSYMHSLGTSCSDPYKINNNYLFRIKCVHEENLGASYSFNCKKTSIYLPRSVTVLIDLNIKREGEQQETIHDIRAFGFEVS